MKHFISTMLLVSVISATCIVAAQFTADATATTGASLSPTGANMTNNVNPNTLTSAQIMQIQQTLKNDGVAVNVDGIWSPGMTTALSQYQTAQGLPANGTLTAQTVTDLGVNLSANTPAGMNTLSPAAGSSTIGTSPTSPTSPTGPGNTISGGTGDATGAAGGGGTNGGSIGSVGGANGVAGGGGTNGGSIGGVGGAAGR